MFLIILFTLSQVLSDAEGIKLLLQEELERRADKWVLTQEFILREEKPLHPFGWIIKDGIAEYFNRRGKKVYLKGEGNRGVLTLRVLSLEVAYNKTGRIFRPRVERNIRGVVRLSFMDRRGLFLWADEISFEGTDQIKKSDLERVRVNGLSPKIMAGSSMIEPLLATLAVGVLIIALYTVGY